MHKNSVLDCLASCLPYAYTIIVLGYCDVHTAGRGGGWCEVKAGGWAWRGCVTDAVLLYFRLPGDRRQGSSRCARQAEMSGRACRPQTCQVVPGLLPIHLRVYQDRLFLPVVQHSRGSRLAWPPSNFSALWRCVGGMG